LGGTKIDGHTDKEVEPT